jgi:hypothetical protein
MSALFSLCLPLGVLATPPPAPAAPAPSAGSAPSAGEGLHDISPPLDIFPYPLWMVVLAVLLLLVILGLAVWGGVRLARRRTGPPPPTPSEQALAWLAMLKERAREMEPYAFSIEVSDVLRTFIGKARFRLPATNQTSPEFIAAISQSPLFSVQDRTLLGRFAEKCDMIKFARIEATSDDNLELVTSALDFVQGGQG